MPYVIGAGYGVRLGDPDTDEAEECRGAGEPWCQGLYVEGGDGYDGWCPSCADRQFPDDDDHSASEDRLTIPAVSVASVPRPLPGPLPATPTGPEPTRTVG